MAFRIPAARPGSSVPGCGCRTALVSQCWVGQLLSPGSPTAHAVSTAAHAASGVQQAVPGRRQGSSSLGRAIGCAGAQAASGAAHAACSMHQVRDRLCPGSAAADAGRLQPMQHALGAQIVAARNSEAVSRAPSVLYRSARTHNVSAAAHAICTGCNKHATGWILAAPPAHTIRPCSMHQVCSGADPGTAKR